MQGWWALDNDSLSHVEISNTHWIWHYGDDAASDTSTILITHRLPKCVDPSIPADFVNLIQGNDTLPNELVGLTDSTLSLMYCLRGNFVLFRKLQDE